ncbi:MAG: hypothetical protein WBQ26_06415 [Gemmatimonadaceae bacterium]
MTLATVALLPLTAVAAAAQIANQSDISGISITSSSIVSPVFSVSLGGTIRVITFITPQIATAFQQAAARINAQLNSQTFATDQGIVPPPVTQNLLYEVASGGPGSGPASTQLLNVLTADNASPQTMANAEAFVEAFRGLLAKGIVMNLEFFNSLTATQFANAVAAYNAFIDSSSEAFLVAPVPEVAAIHAILVQLAPR